MHHCPALIHLGALRSISQLSYFARDNWRPEMKSMGMTGFIGELVVVPVGLPYSQWHETAREHDVHCKWASNFCKLNNIWWEEQFGRHLARRGHIYFCYLKLVTPIHSLVLSLCMHRCKVGRGTRLLPSMAHPIMKQMNEDVLYIKDWHCTMKYLFRWYKVVRV